MSTTATALYGFILIAFLSSADILAYYLGAPTDVRRPISLLLISIAIPYSAFAVRIFHANPQVGKSNIVDSVKGNGAVTGEPTDESNRTDSG